MKMRSNRDLDSKTPRHNRQGFTPREPPHPPSPPLTPSLHLSQNNNREQRSCSRSRRGAPGSGMVPPRRAPRLASPLLTPSSCRLQRWPSNLWKFLERELRECRGGVWINFCRGPLNPIQLHYSLGCFVRRR